MTACGLEYFWDNPEHQERRTKDFLLLTCPLKKFKVLFDRNSCLDPVSPFSPQTAMQTFATVPAFQSSPVATCTSYTVTDNNNKKNKPYCPAPEDPLENEMATCSSSGAWEIPWAEKPGGLQSVESQRVRYN